LLLLLAVVLRILLRPLGTARYSEYDSKIFLRQRIELEREKWRS
jgi:hypothetical protein